MTGPGMGCRCLRSSSRRLACLRHRVRSWPPHPACLCYQSCCYPVCGPFQTTLNLHRGDPPLSSTRPGATSSTASAMSLTAGASAGRRVRCCRLSSPHPAHAGSSSLRSSAGRGSFLLVQLAFPCHRHSCSCCSTRVRHCYLHRASCPHCHLVACLGPGLPPQPPLSTSWPFLRLRTLGS